MVSERLRSSILSAVSHDLRTPLTALVGLADALAVGRPPLPGPQRESAEAIRNQAIRLSGLVGNLLDMARLNAGEVKLRREWQPLEEVIGSSIKLLEKILLDHPVSVKLAAGLPLLEFDAVLIERVFCNLLENAAKYSPPGARIEITARRLDAAVETAVCDEGPGIAAGHADDIFDMFVRGTRESALPGVGLGLAICRTIVEAHGGAIVASNRPQSGACFVFTLPTGNPPVIEAEEAHVEGSHG
jgi:two-component system sensor histidine kinase KdpD